MSTRTIGLGLVLASLLAGCGMFSGSSDSGREGGSRAEDPYAGSLPSGGGANVVQTSDKPESGGIAMMAALFGFGADRSSNGGGGSGGPAGVGVNSYLWRATLDTVSFMPMASADPFGGVIITDWYSPAEAAGERFKVNIFILGRELRADGVRCTVFRQKRDPNGQWTDAPVDQATGINIENAILSRARQMRLSTASK